MKCITFLHSQHQLIGRLDSRRTCQLSSVFVTDCTGFSHKIYHCLKIFHIMDNLHRDRLLIVFKRQYMYFKCIVSHWQRFYDSQGNRCSCRFQELSADLYKCLLYNFSYLHQGEWMDCKFCTFHLVKLPVIGYRDRVHIFYRLLELLSTRGSVSNGRH